MNDVRGRAACYRQDWIGGIRSGLGYSQQIQNNTILKLVFIISFAHLKFFQLFMTGY